MDISVVAQAKLASLISTKDNQVICACILKQYDASVFDSEDLSCSDWLLLFVWECLFPRKLLEVNLCCFRVLDDHFIDEEWVFSALSIVIPAPDVQAAAPCASDCVRLTDRKLHKRCLVRQLFLIKLHELR